MENHYNYCKDTIEDEILMQNSSKEEDSLLIDLVKSYPHLYDKTNKDFKDVFMKNNSWKEIAQVLNAAVSECQNRWLRLRERYSREKKLRDIETRSGSGATTRQPFHLYDQMNFLFKFVKSRKSMTNLLRSKRPLIGDSIEKLESDIDFSPSYSPDVSNNETEIHSLFEHNNKALFCR